MADVDDLQNVKLEVEKLGQKVCRSSRQWQSSNFNNNLWQHDDDSNEEQEVWQKLAAAFWKASSLYLIV